MIFLKEILGDELYEQVAAKLDGTDIKLANVADGSFVSKATYDADIEKAKKETAASGDNSEFEAVKSENDNLKKEIEKIKFDSAVELKLATSGAKNAKALKGLIDTSKLTMGENGLEGFDEQLEAIKADNDYLFASALPGGLKQGAAVHKPDGVEKAFADINPGLKLD